MIAAHVDQNMLFGTRIFYHDGAEYGIVHCVRLSNVQHMLPKRQAVACPLTIAQACLQPFNICCARDSAATLLPPHTSHVQTWHGIYLVLCLCVQIHMPAPQAHALLLHAAGPYQRSAAVTGSAWACWRTHAQRIAFEACDCSLALLS